MRPILLTGWTGDDWAAIAGVALPLMEVYAARHGMRFVRCDLAGERPASWMKVPAMLAALRETSCVVWIDADVVIEDGRHDLLAEVPSGCVQAMVEHDTECGLVPNCGVWVVRSQMAPTLREAWDCGRHVDHPWWEQAVVLEQMGYHVDGPAATLDTPTTLYERTQFLSATWNDHPRDARRAERVRFRHITGYGDRLAAVTESAARATWT